MSTQTTTNPTELERTVTGKRWRVDPTRSRIEFRTPTFWGLMTVKGHFERYDGTLDLTHMPAIELIIDAASLNTNNNLRDKHLRSPDFFNVGIHPRVRFVSDSATLEGERLTVGGQLYASGGSMPLDVDATVRLDDGELQVDASTRADYQELGMSHGTLGMIRTPSELVVHARLVADATD